MFDRWKRASAAVLFLALAPVVHAGTSAYPVNFGDTITYPGTYYLNGDQWGSGVGITIEADYVTLLLGPYTLSGDGSYEGILAEDCEGLKILGGRIVNFEDGISLEGCKRGLLEEVYVGHCDVGVDLDYCRDFLLSRVQSNYNEDDGFEVEDCEWNYFRSCQASHNGDDGFDLGSEEGDGSMYNLVFECTATHNYDDGIELYNSSWNRLVHNRCSSNWDAGILLDTDSVTTVDGDEWVGSNYNVVRYNECAYNDYGIVVEEGCVGNYLTGNVALFNHSYVDLVDENWNCVNFWYINLFWIAGGAGADCIE